MIIRLYDSLKAENWIHLASLSKIEIPNNLTNRYIISAKFVNQNRTLVHPNYETYRTSILGLVFFSSSMLEGTISASDLLVTTLGSKSPT